MSVSKVGMFGACIARRWTAHKRAAMPTPAHTLERSFEALTLKVELPGINKASELDLNIGATQLHLVAPPE